MWKIIKWFNKRLNEMLCVRYKVMLWMGCVPRIKPLGAGFVVGLDHYGSAPPQFGNAFSEGNVCMQDSFITTVRRTVEGRDWDGTPVIRDWVGGMATYPADMRGMWKVHVMFDRDSYGNFEGIWFLDEDDRYREVDIERCNTENNKEILISVHDGEDSETGRRLYNHQYPLPDYNVEFTFRLRPFTRVYINGVLVFVGLQWRMPREGTFILNSGTVPGVDATEGNFIIYDVIHKT